MARPISQIPPDKLEAVAHNAIEPRHAFFLGPYIVGMMVDAILFGVILQLYIKWHVYSRLDDRKIVRYLVWYLMFLGLTSTTFLIAWIFHLFIYNFGSYGQFFRLDWTTWWFVLNMAGRLPVSIFFAHRAWEMTRRNKPFAVFIGLLFLTVFATSFPTKILYRKDANLTLTLVISHMGCEAVADIIVTATIAICLFRSKTGWKGTDQLISRLLFLVVETQLPPTILTILFLGLFVRLETRPITNFYFCAPKVYILCLMIILNSRQKLRKDLSIHQDYPLSTLSKEGAQSLPYAGPGRVSTQIRVTTETTTHVHRNTARPKFSVNRAPLEEDLQVQLDGEGDTPDGGDGGETDKDSLEGRMNSSEVRLTKVKEDV